MPTLTGRLEKPGETFSLELKDLLNELRRRHWTLIRWGPEDGPCLMAAMFKWQACADVLILRDEHQATGYRVPTMDDSGVFNPDRVSYQYHASPLWTLRAILGLPEPGQPGSPMALETPASACFVSEDLPKPVLIRPLG
ncbi:hypothetical protein CDG81_19090 [Actinopolyspora erythraea]|uniref:Uncharacterized protein n=1 Tax=Actinopolyspora erythraea TaxID=414996 RepID=A0A099D7W6_9ACTN|nr:hypothetical protein [Actinopolyspora erythraea]ASU80020.1 hypothetical protein CDG81_19090 [Actinopolyspora erythraea]KGI82253.1 hypothetical protein IL38_05825 [Actinopolyspora erythraea]